MKYIDKFFEQYTKEYEELIKDKSNQKKIKLFFRQILKIKKNKNKIMIAGNGGSAAISSHFSVDLTKNAGIRCINFNESDLITCFSNDYGYHKWIEKALKFYGDKGDMIILISSSGKSKNMIEAANFAKKNNYFLITLTGFFGSNRLSKLGKINFVVNSKKYNHIENVHQYILLFIVDLVSQKNNIY